MQSIWFPLISAIVILAPTAYALAHDLIPRAIGLPLALGGGLLLFDAAFGFGELPKLVVGTPPPGEAEDYRRRFFYSFPKALPRYAVAVAISGGTLIAALILGDGDWFAWPLLGGMIGYGGLLVHQTITSV